MGGVLGKLFDSVSGGAVSKVIDRVLPDRMSEKEKADLQRELELELLKSQTSIIEAEANSDDAYVSRARPTFLYIGYAVIVFNFILLPGIQYFTSGAMVPLVLPEGFWYLFGTGYLGYTGARSADKNKWFASFSK
jgi:hypothetical protein